MRTFNKGGIAVPEHKLTAGKKIINIPAPREVIVTFSQHIGALAVCCVKIGEKVHRGDVIAKANGPVSANVHTPITGTVKKMGKAKTAFGYMADTVTVVADDEDVEYDKTSHFQHRTRQEISALTPEDIKSIIADAGIVGLGGAAFPTKVKLSPPPGMKAELLIVNGVECEPYLTNDHALMLEKTCQIVEGIRYIMRAAGVKKAVIAIENNKPDAILEFCQLLEDDTQISVVPLRVKYPQGSEKQLIKAILHKEVPNGGLPIATGAIVQNVATAYAVYRAVKYREPLMDRIITVTGPEVVVPGNYRVSLGTPLSTVIDAAGGVPENTGKIILGGPMMGRAIVSKDAPTIKGVSGILMMPREESLRKDPEPCIRCAACVRSCPMGLEPYLLMTLTENEEWEELQRHNVANCIACGCCSFACPANRPILDYIKLGKATVMRLAKEKSKKA